MDEQELFRNGNETDADAAPPDGEEYARDGGECAPDYEEADGTEENAEFGEAEEYEYAEESAEAAEDGGEYEEYEGYEEEYEGYEEYDESDESEEPEEEPENLAEIAERILGARHARVSTAAPIRVRTENNTHLPSGHTAVFQQRQSDGPVQPAPSSPTPQTAAPWQSAADYPDFGGDPEEREIEERKKAEEQAAKRRKKAILFGVAAAVILTLIAGLIISAIVKSKRAGEQPEEPGKTVSEAGEPGRPDDTLPAEGNAGEGGEENDPVSPVDAQTGEEGGTGEDGTGEVGEPDTSGEAGEPENPGGTEAQQPGSVTGQTEEPPTGGETEAGDGWQQIEPPVAEAEKIWIMLDFYDRQNITVFTEPTTVAAILAENNTSLLPGERIDSVDLNALITESVTIKVDKYETITENITRTTQHETERIEIDTIPRGDVVSLQAGADGKSVMHYTVTYKNGVEFERRLDSEEVIVPAVTERVQVGVGGTLVGADGVTYSYSWKRVCPATYYNLPGPTYIGKEADETIVAVDTNHIPYYTRMYIRNDRYDFGVRTAADGGPKLYEWQVDIWVSPSNPYYSLISSEGYVHDMVIYFLD